MRPRSGAWAGDCGGVQSRVPRGVPGGVAALRHFALPALVLISPESWECRIQPGRERGSHKQADRKSGDSTKAWAAVTQASPLCNEVRTSPLEGGDGLFLLLFGRWKWRTMCWVEPAHCFLLFSWAGAYFHVNSWFEQILFFFFGSSKFCLFFNKSSSNEVSHGDTYLSQPANSPVKGCEAWSFACSCLRCVCIGWQAKTVVCAVAYSGRSEKGVSWLHPGRGVTAEREAGGSERISVV